MQNGETKIHLGPNQVIFGPCISGRIGASEYDMVHCIKSDMLSKAATSSHILHDKVTSGCHFVPIPAKLPHFQTVQQENESCSPASSDDTVQLRVQVPSEMPVSIHTSLYHYWQTTNCESDAVSRDQTFYGG